MIFRMPAWEPEPGLARSYVDRANGEYAFTFTPLVPGQHTVRGRLTPSVGEFSTLGKIGAA